MIPPATLESAAANRATLAYPIGVEDSASITFPLTINFLAAGAVELDGAGSGAIGEGVWPFAVSRIVKARIERINFRIIQILLFAVFDSADLKQFKRKLLIKS